MTDTKPCTYQSCKNVFERQPNTPDGTWKQLSRCPKCREKARSSRPGNVDKPTTMMGRYEVKSETIDRFLYSKVLCTTSISDAIFQTES